ncbi:DUF3102 domain-containing protein, partial [Planctomycetota bacterium]
QNISRKPKPFDSGFCPVPGSGGIFYGVVPMNTDQITTTRTDEIISLHRELEGIYKATLPKAIRIGELLAEVKAELDHGAFIPWIKTNLPFSERTARNYMNLYQNRAALKTASVADLTGAYKMLSPPKAETGSPDKNKLLIPPAGHSLVGFAPIRSEHEAILGRGTVIYYIEPAVNGAYYYISVSYGGGEPGLNKTTPEAVWRDDLFEWLNKLCDAENIIGQIESRRRSLRYNRFLYDSLDDYRANFADRLCPPDEKSGASLEAIEMAP